MKKIYIPQKLMPAVLDGTKTQYRVLIDSIGIIPAWAELLSFENGTAKFGHERSADFHCFKCPYKIGEKVLFDDAEKETCLQITGITVEQDEVQWFWVFEFKEVK